MLFRSVCWLIDAGSKKIDPEDTEAANVISQSGKPVILVANKADTAAPSAVDKLAHPCAVDGTRPSCPSDTLSIYEKQCKNIVGKLAISAKLGRGLDALIDMILPLLPEGTPWYDPDILMDSTERFMASEIIRGKVLSLLRDEVPHRTAVEIEEYKSPDEYPEKKRLYIRASLIVETEGQKAILIGAGGKMIKKIGRSARVDLEELTGWPVYLELWAKVSPNWRRSELMLRRLGYAASED